MGNCCSKTSSPSNNEDGSHPHVNSNNNNNNDQQQERPVGASTSSDAEQQQQQQPAAAAAQQQQQQPQTAIVEQSLPVSPAVDLAPPAVANNENKKNDDGNADDGGGDDGMGGSQGALSTTRAQRGDDSETPSLALSANAQAADLQQSLLKSTDAQAPASDGTGAPFGDFGNPVSSSSSSSSESSGTNNEPHEHHKQQQHHHHRKKQEQCYLPQRLTALGLEVHMSMYCDSSNESGTATITTTTTGSGSGSGGAVDSKESLPWSPHASPDGSPAAAAAGGKALPPASPSLKKQQEARGRARRLNEFLDTEAARFRVTESSALPGSDVGLFQVQQHDVFDDAAPHRQHHTHL